MTPLAGFLDMMLRGLALVALSASVGGVGYALWAMFNLKAEFLAEVSHAPMGILAVLMGWGRWIELRLPEGASGVPGWVWALSMGLIGAILLGYRET
jgi:hypothetical protein